MAFIDDVTALEAGIAGGFVGVGVGVAAVAAADSSHPERLFLALTAAGAVTGVGLWALRRG